VAAEFIAHGGEEFVSVVGVSARAESLVESGGEDVGGNAFVDASLDGPTAFA
jgi:hypothetical protein